MPTLLDFKNFINSAWAVYPMGNFGDDTIGNYIWEKTTSSKDLLKGDGSTAGTFPTFVANTDHDTEYYTFDGATDYVSGWPTMPAAYTVIAAKSSAYVAGQPSIQSCNDTTIETLLTTPGSYTGNIHNIVIFDWVLSDLELAHAEQHMLRRVWRDTYVDPFTARLIRTGECVLQLYGELESAPHTDYAQGLGSTDDGTGWDNGITFPLSDSAVIMDSDASLDVDEITIFFKMSNKTSNTYHICQNGSNYEFHAIVYDAACMLTFNDSFKYLSSADTLNTIAVTNTHLEKPDFFINGIYVGTGDIKTAISAAGADQLYIGNNAAQTDRFESTIKMFSVFNKKLSEKEIMVIHLAAMAERSF